MADVLEFPEIFQEFRGAMNPGRLKFQTSTITFKNIKTGKLDQHSAGDLEKGFWILRARGHCLKLIFKPGLTFKYDGFKESDFDRLSNFLQKSYEVKLEKKDSSLKGWNWGNAYFNGNTLDFKVDNNSAFEIPLANISHSLTSKNEVTIEFHQNDDAPISLMEVRFHIPSDINSDMDPVMEFHNNIMSKADVVQATGDAITIFSEVQCLTPRGRYDIKIYPTFLQLHGKTFDYKIPYTTILRLFLLPHRDNRQFFFMVSLDPPIKQGQTRYHFLILLFSKEVETTLELSLSEQDIEQKYEGKLQKEMVGPEHEVISRVMKVLVNKKITVPGSFLGHTKTHSIACSYRAATGYLYPLERGFVFVHKPPIHVRFDEIVAVNFGRSAGSTRYFDFDVETLSGPVYNFVGIEKDEYSYLFDFVKQKNLRVKNIDKTDGKSVPTYTLDDMEGSDDEDKVHNAYMEKMKAEREDDDDESDESFKPDDNTSEPDDEYDSQHESSSEDGEDGEKKKKKKRDKSDEDDDDKKGSDDSDSDKKPKKKSKNESSKKEKEDESEDEKEKKPKKEKKKEKQKEKQSKKTDKKKKPRDANKPKRPQTAYFLWLNENRASLKEEFPGISITDLSKKAGERWKEIKDKTKWEKLAGKEKEAYEKAMEKYQREKESESKGGDGFKSKEFVAEEDEDSKKGSDGEGKSDDDNDDE